MVVCSFPGRVSLTTAADPPTSAEALHLFREIPKVSQRGKAEERSHSKAIHDATTKPFEYTAYYRTYSDETNLVRNVKSIMIRRQPHVGLLSSVRAIVALGWRATVE